MSAIGQASSVPVASPGSLRGGRGGGRGHIRGQGRVTAASGRGQGARVGTADGSYAAPSVPSTAAQVNIQEILNQHTQQLMRNLETREEKIKEWTKNELQTYHDAAKSFTTAHHIGDLADVQPSQADQNKTVIVLNEVQLDEVQDALHGYRDVARRFDQMQAKLSKAEDQIQLLQEKVNSLRQENSRHLRGTRRARSDASSDPESMTDSDCDMETSDRVTRRKSSGRTKSVKKARVKKMLEPGQDVSVQEAFKDLLRLRMGLDKSEPWPPLPDVDESSADWPRAPPSVDPSDPLAHIDPALRDDLPLGEPLLRMDWVYGRLDDPHFISILDELSEELVEKADNFDLPKEEEKRSLERVRAACHRTLEEVKKQARLALIKTREELADMEARKKAADRRRSRHRTRTDCRKKAVLGDSILFGAAELAMITDEGVEWDLSESETIADLALLSDHQASRQVSRGICPEWFSQENLDTQAKAHKEVPVTRYSYKLLSARGLSPYTSEKALSKQICRIQVSSTFAEENPRLVRFVSKNSPPFKPEHGGIADNADQWGSPIAHLVMLGNNMDQDPESGNSGNNENEAGAEGPGGSDGMDDE
ncbi:hypothetical protein CF326_g4811 [Tilletia indica]|nr:hypothetical protein CF326_g4811 [Tilletia indica]